MDLNHFQCFCFPGSISNRINLSNICDGIDLASLLVKIGNGKLHVGLILLQFWHKNVFYDDLLLGFEWFPPMLFLSSLLFFWKLHSTRETRLFKSFNFMRNWLIRLLLFWLNTPNIYLFHVNNRNFKKGCEICSKLTIKTPEKRQWRLSGVFIVKSPHTSHLFPFSVVSIVDF